MDNWESLRSQLHSIDGRGYKSYRSVRGRYQFGNFELIVDYVQGDPYAAPSKLRARVPWDVAGFPDWADSSASRRIALRDFLGRRFDGLAREISQRRGSGKSGLVAIDGPGQEVLERTAVVLDSDAVEARFVTGLPAKGRRVLGLQAAEMLCQDLPEVIDRALLFEALDEGELRRHLETVEDADALRDQLAGRGLVGFVADGAILPRRSGVDPRPLREGAVEFRSPDSLRVTLDRPNGNPITGMGVPQGVTLIVGGGYHGKSTLLDALALGVYNHIPGDGREFAVCVPDAVVIRAEDGRRVARCDISPFIRGLPQGRSTTDFSTENASGSTSQAANIVEALEAGAEALLIDEDTSATNFMIRDHRMQRLVAGQKEPITPFIDKVRQLYEEGGVSTVLVMGGSGDYFDVADTVVAMEDFQPREVTDKARAIAEEDPSKRRPEGGTTFGAIAERAPLPASIDPSRGKRSVKLKVRETDEILFGTDEIDLSAVPQLVDRSQLRAIAEALVRIKKRYADGERGMGQILDLIMQEIDREGLDPLTPFVPGDLARFRRFELAAALNRLRTLEVRQLEKERI